MRVAILFAAAMLLCPIALHAQHKMGSKTMPHLEFSMEATRVQSHRTTDSSAVELVFPGRIVSDIAVVWTLTPQPTRAYGPPNLTLVQDVMGHSHPMGQTVIPLTWELALDGGHYRAMTLTPENNLQAIIPPGMHTFQLRASSSPLLMQAAGYYRLQLATQIGPQF